MIASHFKYPAAVLAMFIGIAPTYSHAADAAGFLTALDGDWRGAGEARTGLNMEMGRVACRLSAGYDDGKSTLTSTGKCGTTQGTRSLNGFVKAQGNNISGQFFGPLRSDGASYQRNRLVGDALVSEMQVTERGKMVRMRTSVSKPQGDKFTVTSEIYDNSSKSWAPSANITFRKD